ncbi:MAG: hypothetical protein JXQ73_17135 [Phycisphaerae bacterium]|nr:hypothetical protein [Phycisphaerae bacterium]
MQVAALEELTDGAVKDGPPVPELAGIVFGVDGAKVVEVLADEAVEVGFRRLTGAVDTGRLVDQATQGASLLPQGLASLRHLSSVYVRSILMGCARRASGLVGDLGVQRFQFGQRLGDRAMNALEVLVEATYPPRKATPLIRLQTRRAARLVIPLKERRAWLLS